MQLNYDSILFWLSHIMERVHLGLILAGCSTNRRKDVVVLWTFVDGKGFLASDTRAAHRAVTPKEVVKVITGGCFMRSHGSKNANLMKREVGRRVVGDP